MQLSDIPELSKQERNLLAGLNASEQGKRVLELMRRELARLDKQNRFIGGENKTSAAQWIAEFLELVDSNNSTETPPDEPDGPLASDQSPI